MAASRKLSVVAALLLMTLLSTGVASAQVPPAPADLGVITCNSVAVPPIVRAEGIAECAGSAGTGERALRVSVDAALRAGIFKASGSFDPMGFWDERER